MIFTHGINILGHHVDAWVKKDSEGFIIFIRAATLEEIKEFCQ